MITKARALAGTHLGIYGFHMETKPSPVTLLTGVIVSEMKEAGMPVTELSERTGIPHVTLRRRLKTGRGLGVEEMFSIANALGMTGASLIARAEQTASVSALASSRSRAATEGVA